MSFLFFYWTIPLNISNSELPVQYPHAAIDRYSEKHVVYATRPDDDSCFLWYTRTTNGIWPDSGRIIFHPTTGYGLQDAKIAVDTLGNPHIIFCRLMGTTSGRIYYMFHNGSQWIGPVNLSDSFLHPCSTPNIAIDESSYVHIVFDDYNDGGLYYSVKKNNQWSTPELISNIPIANYYPVIKCKNGIVYVIWLNRDAMGYYHLYFSMRVNGVWSTPKKISRENRFYPNSCAYTINLDNEDIPIVAWREKWQNKKGVSIAICFSKYPFDEVEEIKSKLIYLQVYTDGHHIPHILGSVDTTLTETNILDYAKIENSWVCETIPRDYVNFTIRNNVLLDSIGKVHLIFSGHYPDYHNIDIYYISEYNPSFVPEDIKKESIIIYSETLEIDVKRYCKIYDITGKIVKEIRGRRGKIFIGNVPSGIYILETDNEIKKIIIIH